MSSSQIPVDIDKPAQFLGKDMDEVAVISMLLAMGFLTGLFLPAFAATYFVSKAYAKFRGNQSNNFLLHAMYWHGVADPSTRTLPSGIEREFR